jgi:outer membrane receptor protein involved in Fe transport
MKTHRHALLTTSLLVGFTALAPQVGRAAETDAGSDGPLTTNGTGHAAALVALQGQAGAAAAARRDCPDGSAPVNGQCPSAVKEVVVTGSRIPRARTTTDQPVEVITKQDIDDRAFANLADAINNLPASGAGVTPIGVQNSFGTGRNYIDLFGLGSTHTLTLVNGLRFVGDNPTNFFSTTSGGNQVDLNALPTLFLDHIDSVYATGAAVYGTDAVAGVVNVELTKHFTGEEFIVQGGISDFADIPRYTVEAAIGRDFNLFGGRLNVAVDFQYDKTNALNQNDRPWLSNGLSFVANPNYNGPGTGPQQIVIPNFRFPSLTAGGVPFMLDNFTPLTADGTPYTTPGAKIVNFATGGNLVPENIGPLYNYPIDLFAFTNSSGGDGLNLAQLSSLQTPLNRKVFTGMINYEINPHLRWDTYVFYSDNIAVETVRQPNYNVVFFGAANACNQPSGSSGSLLICGDNAFLNSQAKGVLTANGIALSPNTPAFYLSRDNTDITPDPISSYVHTLNIASTLTGDFDLFSRNFAWNVSASRGEAYSFFHQMGIIYSRPDTINPAAGDLFGNALDSVMVGGSPECRIKAMNPGSTDPNIANCLPYNPFGVSNPGNGASARYFTGAFDDKAKNVQDDILGNIGFTIIHLPGGDAKMELGYEYRKLQTSFTPNENALLGEGNSVPIDGIKAGYHTNEYYTEMRIPVFGADFNFPLAYRLSIDGAYRNVESSQAGTNKAWQWGFNYQPVRDLTLRYSRSKTYAAPTLGEAFAPQTSAYDFATDPCVVSQITQGPDPSVRAKNCTALLNGLGINPSTFTTDPSNNASVPIMAGGNPKLKNEVGNSFTYGVVVQPRWTPGLTLTADYIQVTITNALEAFNLTQEAAQCFDSPNYPNDPSCAAIQRDPKSGFIIGGTESFINAGFQRFQAVNYSLFYDRPVNKIPGVSLLPFVNPSADLGRLTANVNIVNIRSFTNSIDGSTQDETQFAGTIDTPKWRWQAAFTYSRGPWRAGWVTHYIGPALYSTTTGPANQIPYQLKEYMTHDASLAYRLTPNIRLQFNVNNMFDTPPPSPVGTYNVTFYDFIGRYYLFSIRGKF